VAALIAATPAAPPWVVESVRVRYTQFAQSGLGYQSAAGPMGSPGSEWARIEQPQAEVTARVGERLVQHIWIPVDAVTAASPDHSRYGQPYDFVDTVSTASRSTLTGTLDTLTSYRADAVTDVSFRAAFHIEEPFESWIVGMGAARSFAEDNTVVGASLNQVIDWFDRFDLNGDRHGRVTRSTTNVNLDVTQVLSPTTLANVGYGGTLQRGELTNTWSSVRMADGTRGTEVVPNDRWRHALAARLAQWLPWEGALLTSYRAYFDSWGIGAHSVEAVVHQRLWPGFTLRANYRYHWQSAPGFFTIAAEPMGMGYRTSDSDLAALHAQTWGGAAMIDLPLVRGAHHLHLDLGYERYVRSNNLTVLVTTCGLGFTF
jgi:hypothetical protein